MLKVLSGLILLIVINLSQVQAGQAEAVAESDYKAAVATFEQRDYETASTQFKAFLSQHKSHVESMVYLAKISAFQEELDDAEDFLEEALKLAPDNAWVHNQSGDIFGSIAQQASIFSAMGYAEQSLNGYIKGVELAPDNIDYRKDLMRFYLNAPGMAGGDEELALVQAKAIAELDVKQGFLALYKVYFDTEDSKELNSHYASMPESLKQDPDVLFKLGMYKLRTENYIEAVELLEKAVNFGGEKTDFNESKYMAIYQIGRVSVLSKDNIDKGIAALDQYISEAPSVEGLPSQFWAKFRRANLVEMTDKKAAKLIYSDLSKSVDEPELKKELRKKLR